jgi:hypothetical protein
MAAFHLTSRFTGRGRTDFGEISGIDLGTTPVLSAGSSG